MVEKGKEESTSDSDASNENKSSSPYARRKPYAIELRRNRITRQDSNRSSGSSVLPISAEIRRNRGSQQESNRSSISSLVTSLQSYTSAIFTRQTSKNVIETDF